MFYDIYKMFFADNEMFYVNNEMFYVNDKPLNVDDVGNDVNMKNWNDLEKNYIFIYKDFDDNI